MLKINKFFLTVFTCLMVCLLTSCSFGEKEGNESLKTSLLGNSKTIKIYFTKSKGSKGLSFVPVKRQVSKGDSSLNTALTELFLGPYKEEAMQGIMTEIPVGTRLIKTEEAEDEVVVDISSQFLAGGGSATMQLRYLQIYKTLSTICPGKKFYLNIDGKPLKTVGGEGLEVKQPLRKINDYTKNYEETKDLQP